LNLCFCSFPCFPRPGPRSFPFGFFFFFAAYFEFKLPVPWLLTPCRYRSHPPVIRDCRLHVVLAPTARIAPRFPSNPHAVSNLFFFGVDPKEISSPPPFVLFDFLFFGLTPSSSCMVVSLFQPVALFLDSFPPVQPSLCPNLPFLFETVVFPFCLSVNAPDDQFAFLSFCLLSHFLAVSNRRPPPFWLLQKVHAPLYPPGVLVPVSSSLIELWVGLLFAASVF